MPSAMVLGEMLRVVAIAVAQAICEMIGSPDKKLATVKALLPRIRLASEPLR